MAKISVVTQDCERIKKGLQKLIGQNITITVKDRTKLLTRKAVITIVSDNLFCVDVQLGKYNTCSYSYTFLDIKTNKVKIKEAPDLNDEVAVTV